MSKKISAKWGLNYINTKCGAGNLNRLNKCKDTEIPNLQLANH